MIVQSAMYNMMMRNELLYKLFTCCARTINDTDTNTANMQIKMLNQGLGMYRVKQ